MRRRLAIVVLLAIGLPIYGQQESGQPGSDEDKGHSAPAPSSAPAGKAKCVVQENGTTVQCEWTTANAPSCLNRLFMPENLPNLLLFVVGVGGIVVALSTLEKIERQTKATESGARTAAKDLSISSRAWVNAKVKHHTI